MLRLKNPKTTIAGILAALFTSLAASGELSATQKQVVGLLAAMSGSAFAYFAKDAEKST